MGRTEQAADAREDARGLAAQAVKLYDSGDYALALELFEKADALYRTPVYRVYVARTYAKLGKLRRSVAKYDEAILMPPPQGAPPSFAEAQQTAVDERAETARRIPILRVEVTGAPAQVVTLTVDQEPVSTLGRLRLELDPGRHLIAATAPGSRGGSQTVELQEGASASVLVALPPLHDAAAPPPHDAARRRWRSAALTTGAVGGAALVVAIATGAALAEKRSAILQDCPNELCTPAGRTLINGLAPLENVNLGSWIFAGTGAAATAVFLLLDLRGPAPATTIVPGPLPGGAGIWGTRRF